MSAAGRSAPRGAALRVAGLLGVLLAAACSSVPTAPSGGRGAQGMGPAPGSECAPRSANGGYYLDDGPGRNAPADPAAVPDAVPRAEPLHPYANRPYTVFGRAYIPLTDITTHRERGRASWYGCKFHGRPTSSGERYDMYGMTAAHPTLPIPSYVRVTNLRNGRSVVVRVNDRGPFLNQRVIDLSYTAAARLGYVEAGSAEVEVEWLPMRGDAPMLAARGPATTRADTVRTARAPTPGPAPSASTTAATGAATAVTATTAAAAAAATIGTTATAASTTAATSTAGAAATSATSTTAVTTPSASSMTATSSAAASTAATGAAPASPAAASTASAVLPGPVSPMLAEAQLERLSIETTIDDRRSEPPLALAPSATHGAAIAAAAARSPAVVPAPPGSTPSPASVSPATATTTWLQFGVFGSRENAEALGARVRRELPWLGVPVEVFASGEAWRVHVGPWSRRDDALATAARIAAASSLRPIPVAR